MARSGFLLSLGLALIGALAAAGPAAAQAQQGVMTVRVDEVRKVPLDQTVPVLGRLVAGQQGVVAAQTEGPVEVLLVRVGDRVETGEVIARLDTDALEARRDIAAAHLAEAQAELGVAKSQLALAEQEFTRLEGLRQSAAFSQARYDDARQNVAIAEAQVRRAEAAVESARADLQLAEITLDDAEVRAPFPGVVTERLTDAGAYLQSGAPVVRLLADRSLEVEADVPFQYLGGLEIGTEVGLTLDDGSEHTATVRAIIPAENPLTRTRAVRLTPAFGATSRPLASEQSVTLAIPLGARDKVLSVHKDAIVNRGGQDLVFVVEDGTVQPRPVELGNAVGSRIEVRGGLAPGEQVVVRGNERLRPGDKVRVAGES